MYNGGHISWHELFLVGNQDNHQNLVPKKTEIFKSSQFSNYLDENFWDWSLGEYNKLMQRASM